MYRHTILGLVVVFSLIAAAHAQVDRAGLAGTVSDSSNRALPQTRVVAVQTSTNLQREAISDSSGRYDIPELPVGIYTDHLRTPTASSP